MSHRPQVFHLTFQMRPLLLMPSHLSLFSILGERDDPTSLGSGPRPPRLRSKRCGCALGWITAARRVWRRLGTAALGLAAFAFAGVRQAQGRSLAQLCHENRRLEGDLAL